LKKLHKIMICVAMAMTLVACNQDTTNKKAEVETKKEPEKVVYYSPLRHEETKEDISKNKIYAVMIDNHDDARPQSGLDPCDVIYEYRAEGEYTRYMLLFQQNYPDVIGPVRSARPYFVDTAKEYNAVYIHWGGSEAGLAEIHKRNVVDLDGIALEGIIFHRNKDVGKFAPHNGYIALPEMIEYLNKKDINTMDNNASLSFKEDDEKAKGIDVNEIELNFNPRYKTKFIYNANTNKYQYNRQGEVVIDESSGVEIGTTNVLVLFQKAVVAGPKGTLKLDNIGSGKGLFLQGGKLSEITWEKANEDARTIFKDEDGNEIKFYPGKTFISVVDDESHVFYEKPIDEDAYSNQNNNGENAQKVENK